MNSSMLTISTAIPSEDQAVNIRNIEAMTICAFLIKCKPSTPCPVPDKVKETLVNIC
jgi:hypothetical protein